jgi:hypothetical protein
MPSVLIQDINMVAATAVNINIAMMASPLPPELRPRLMLESPR